MNESINFLNRKMVVGGVTLEWLIELGKGIGKFFLDPLLYFGVLYAIYLGYIRVKRERSNFHVRVQDGWFEARTYLSKGLLLGFVLSIVIFAVGFIIPLAFVLTVSAVTVLFALILKPSVLSPAYTFGVSFFLVMAIYLFQVNVPIFQESFNHIDSAVIPGVALLTGFLLLAEGILISRNAKQHTSPKLIRSKRGLNVGIHETKRLWMVPLLFLVPADALSLPFDFWPIVPVGDQSFTLLFIPYWIGFANQIRSLHPSLSLQIHGKKVFLLGILVSIVGAVGFWVELASIVGVSIAILGRLLISIRQYVRDNGQTYYFSKNQPGIVILDILPGTPADKMELKIGEVIKTVNGVHVQTEQEYYEALQLNRAYCKLEVIDDNGENRFVNRALYEGEHHELGIITFGMENQWKKDVS